MIGFDIHYARDVLMAGELVAIPTETVYGLAGNATLPEVVAKIFKTKERPSFDPLIVHTDDLQKLKPYVHDIPEAALALARVFWPGPLTLILPRTEAIPDIVTSGLPDVAVRIPNHPLTLELLESLDFPLAAPSANPFGYISPTRAEHVQEQLGDKISYILDGGPCKVGVESTIVSFNGPRPTILRKGGLSLETLQHYGGSMALAALSSSNPKAPGMLESHYAPRVPLFVGELHELIEKHGTKNNYLLAFQNYHPDFPRERQRILSRSGSLTEAAQRLFAELRMLDARKPQAILAEFVPEEGLGLAINDRLQRASGLPPRLGTETKD